MAKNTIYFFDKTLSVIDFVSQEKSLYNRQKAILNDTITHKIEVPYSQSAEEAYYFGLKDVDEPNNFLIYKTEKNITNNRGNIELTGIHKFFDDLKGRGYIKEREPHAYIHVPMGYALEGTGWNIGLNTVKGTTKLSFYYTNKLEAFYEIIEAYKAEFKLRIIFENGKITSQLVDLAPKFAEDRGRIYSYGDRLVTVEKEQGFSNIVTALTPKGKGEQVSSAEETGNLRDGYGRRIGIEDVAWSTANGDPVDKPLGQEYIELPDATNLYGYADGSPRLDTITFGDIEDPNELIQAGYEALVAASIPSTQFKTKVDEERPVYLGEYVGIIRDEINLRYKTRVFEIDRNFNNKTDKIIKFGDPIEYKRASAQKREFKKYENTLNDLWRNTTHLITNEAGNTIFYSSDPNTKPVANREGDQWFMTYAHPETGKEEVRLLKWDGADWVEALNTARIADVEFKVDQVETEAQTAQDTADQAVAEASAILDTSDPNSLASKTDSLATKSDEIANRIADLSSEFTFIHKGKLPEPPYKVGQIWLKPEWNYEDTELVTVTHDLLDNMTWNELANAGIAICINPNSEFQWADWEFYPITSALQDESKDIQNEIIKIYNDLKDKADQQDVIDVVDTVEEQSTTMIKFNDDLSARITKNEQTSQGIKNIIGDVTRLDTGETVISAFAKLEGSIDGYKTTVSDLERNLQNLTIEGRNLFIETDSNILTEGAKRTVANTDHIQVDSGKPYFWSDYDSTGQGTLEAYDANGNLIETIKLTDGLKYTPTTTTDYVVLKNFILQDGDEKYRYKFEQNTKPTSYLLAPQDTATPETISQIIHTADTIGKELQDIQVDLSIGETATRLNRAESTALGNKESIAQINSTIDGVDFASWNTTIDTVDSHTQIIGNVDLYNPGTDGTIIENVSTLKRTATSVQDELKTVQTNLREFEEGVIPNPPYKPGMMWLKPQYNFEDTEKFIVNDDLLDNTSWETLSSAGVFMYKRDIETNTFRWVDWERVSADNTDLLDQFEVTRNRFERESDSNRLTIEALSNDGSEQRLKFNDFVQTVDSTVSRIGINLDDLESQITQTREMIDLRVVNDATGKKTNISISDGSILFNIIDNKVHLTDQYFYGGQKFITDHIEATYAEMDNLRVNNTIDAANVNLINLNAANITSGSMSSNRMRVDGDFEMRGKAIRFTNNGELSTIIDRERIHMYDQTNNARYVGSMGATRLLDYQDVSYMSLRHRSPSYMSLDYRGTDSQGNTTYLPYVVFDAYKVNPYNNDSFFTRFLESARFYKNTRFDGDNYFTSGSSALGIRSYTDRMFIGNMVNLTGLMIYKGGTIVVMENGTGKYNLHLINPS